MLKNMILFAIRNFKKEKFYTLINISGLALGLACVLFILLWVQDELSYDRFHEHANQIYRVNDYEKYSNGKDQIFSVNPPDLAPLLEAEYPEIISALRLRNIGKHVVRNQENKYNELGILCVDPDFFEFFSFPLVHGTADGSLTDPSSMIVTEKIALKYFGNTDIIGKTLIIDNKHEYTVTGVLKKLPGNTLLKFNFVLPFKAVENFGYPTENWNYYAYTTFVRLTESANVLAVDAKIKNVIKNHLPDSIVDLSLQPLTDIHLHSGNIWGMGGNGDIRYVYIFSVLAILVLLLACINFMNLATARAGKRSLEVGLRKVIGANKKELIIQFMGETLLYTLVAFILAILLLKLFSPLLALVSGKHITLAPLQDVRIIAGFLLVLFVTGVIAGSYPAFFLSSFQPVRVMKARSGFGLKGKAFRQVLVTFQFIITIILLASSITINRQLHFIRNHKLGYNQRNVLVIDLHRDAGKKYKLLLSDFQKIQNVKSVSGVSFSPAQINQTFTVNQWEGRQEGEMFLTHSLEADENMTETLGIQIKMGRFFSSDFPADPENSLVINETAMKSLGFDDPIGKTVQNKTVIGVISDFNFKSLHEKISPLFINNDPNYFNYLLVLVEPGKMHNTINELKTHWANIIPNVPFEYNFLDENIADYYKSDNKVENVINTFTALALFIASLGLLGLAVFSAEQRTKEIGIRKVLGAPVLKIIYMMTGEYTHWVVVANVIAWPVTYLAMTKWLQSFAYKVRLGWWVFALAGAMVLLIALLSISWQIVRAATANPVKSLRYE